MNICPVCGLRVYPEVEIEFEEERYVGEFECEMRLTIWYCNVGKTCNPVAAANVLDRLAEPFLSTVGRR